MDEDKWIILDNWALIWKETGKRVQRGEAVADHVPGWSSPGWVVSGGTPPKHAGSTGRVWLRMGLSTREYFATVIKAEWVELTAMQALVTGIRE